MHRDQQKNAKKLLTGASRQISRQHTGGAGSIIGITPKSRVDMMKSKIVTSRHEKMPSFITENDRGRDETVTTHSHKNTEKRGTKAAVVKNAIQKSKTEKDLQPEPDRRYHNPRDWNSKLLEAINNTKAFRVD